MIKSSIFWQKPCTNQLENFDFFCRFLKLSFSGLKNILFYPEDQNGLSGLICFDFTRLHKGSIHIITCSSCACAPLFAVHCPFPVSSLWASVHSQQHFFPSTHPLFWLEPLFSSSIITYVHYIFNTTRTFFKQIIILFLYWYMYP